MGNSDREHFDSYRRQTQVKHEILAAYLPAYFHVLKQWDKNLLFIDGFAGRGTYTNTDTGKPVDGSPVLALKLIAGNPDFSKKVSAIFIESDSHLFGKLDKLVQEFYKAHPNIREPYCANGTFSEVVPEIINAVEDHLAPTFLFVDPCGVSGASFDAIRKIMDFKKCEAFIFLNIDGVRRIAGLNKLSNVLVDLLGSEKRAKALYDEFHGTNEVAQRERLILSFYLNALHEEMGAAFTVPFRIEHEDKQVTSHYLIHATKHSLGFKIMKDVMWRRGHAEDQTGGLELAQASRTDFFPLFDIRGDAIKESILEALDNGPQQVKLFCEEWVIRPEDTLAEPAYKIALLELEAEGSIEVLDKKGQALAPAAKRVRRKGKPTLANDYYVRRAKEKK